ncbi:RNA polymerase sigma factor SigJ [Chelatococcus sp. SYSU_G07232]|uniref:RNA polymerase sigma factor SigJ n=1 Tax=Chelatococcus albus TaxID=3047466 RepID=A0ABT7AL15_9HYPH|nr:RNA polymerase sigma factor SigJ [Chelatococcus sp. SYSU_G07232]MDJ1159519.1 RNA polymerase sigma factor SigJ [Chelatococcus sp. SYSU_G07232]
MDVAARTPGHGKAAVFEAKRQRLMSVAYRMLGSVSDAEDVVQDAYLRWHAAPEVAIRVPEAWLLAVVTRLALDRLRAAKRERDAYVGPWLPEPWAGGAGVAEAPDAAHEQAEELSYAFLVLLERLAPEERAAFLLREVFEADYALVAATLERKEAACRQLVHRARERLAAGRARRVATAAEKADLLRRFQAAARAQDGETLARLLAPDATFTADGGGKTFAARKVLEGAARIAHVVLGIRRKAPGPEVDRLVWLDGEPAMTVWRDGVLRTVTLVDVDEGRIRAIYNVLNPDKLRHCAVASS